MTNLQPRDVLFIDEIHRLAPAVEEILYPALEEFQLDLMIGEGPAARSVRIDLPPFTLIGATTRTGLLTTPLRDRFGILSRLHFYDHAELEAIVGARRRDPGPAAHPRRRGRDRPAGARTPRVAGRLLRRVRDFATVAGNAEVDAAVADARSPSSRSTTSAWTAWTGATSGIAESYGGGPVGVDTLAAALSEQRDTLEEVVEPYLLQQGLLQRTPRGRLLTRIAWQHLGLAPPRDAEAQIGLFDDDPLPTRTTGADERPGRSRRACTASASGSTTRTPTPPASSTTPPISSSPSARAPRCCALGLDHVTLRARFGLVFTVRRCSIDYRAPARLDDLLEIQTRLVRLGGASLELEQRVLRATQLLAVLELRLALLGADLRVMRRPALIGAFDRLRAPSPKRRCGTWLASSTVLDKQQLGGVWCGANTIRQQPSWLPNVHFPCGRPSPIDGLPGHLAVVPHG